MVKITFRLAVSFYGVLDELHFRKKRQVIITAFLGIRFLLFYRMAVIKIHISIFSKRDANTENIKMDSVEICIPTPFQWLPRRGKGCLN